MISSTVSSSFIFSERLTSITSLSLKQITVILKENVSKTYKSTGRSDNAEHFCRHLNYSRFLHLGTLQKFYIYESGKNINIYETYTNFAFMYLAKH